MGLFKNMTVKLTHRILAGGLHDLTKADADALPLVTLVGAQSLLQDGNNLRENLLPQFSHQISQRSSSDLKPQPNTASVKSSFGTTAREYMCLQKSEGPYRSLVGAGRSQKAQQQSEEGWEDLSKSPGSVGDHDLPHVEGSLSDHQLSV